jgi:glyoxylase-like metal-dependent hydrolase (beta-lactamase superfamily II)
MILRQYLDAHPVAASYLLGCSGKGSGVVVDPVAPIDRYIDDAAAAGVSIDYVIDTHVHADHYSAARSLAELTGAEYVLWSGAEVEYPFMGVDDGDVLEAGNVRLDIMHTPGHTPEHIMLLITDRARADKPWALLSGHTLMVGDMGRTELASSAEEGARALFASGQRLKRLPDYVEILPGAFSGSVCGRGLSGKPLSTIGFEKRYNRVFSIEDEDEFVAAMLRDIPPRPPGADEIRAANSRMVAVGA